MKRGDGNSLSAAEMVNRYASVFGNYGEQKELAARFLIASEMIEHINDSLDGGRLITQVHRTLVFKQAHGSEISFEPYCTARVGAGVRFLGNRLVRAQVHPLPADALSVLPGGQYPEELIVVDTDAGIGVNIRQSLEVLPSDGIVPRHYSANHEEFLRRVTQTAPRGHLHWDNSPI